MFLYILPKEYKVVTLGHIVKNKERRGENILLGNGSTSLNVWLIWWLLSSFTVSSDLLTDLLKLGIKLSDLFLQHQRRFLVTLPGSFKNNLASLGSNKQYNKANSMNIREKKPNEMKIRSLQNFEFYSWHWNDADNVFIVECGIWWCNIYMAWYHKYLVFRLTQQNIPKSCCCNTARHTLSCVST